MACKACSLQGAVFHPAKLIFMAKSGVIVFDETTLIQVNIFPSLSLSVPVMSVYFYPSVYVRKNINVVENH